MPWFHKANLKALGHLATCCLTCHAALFTGLLLAYTDQMITEISSKETGDFRDLLFESLC